MAFEVELEELQKESILDSNRILNEYFTLNNINLKTQINSPIDFTTLDTFGKKFNEFINFGDSKRNFKITKGTINYWLKMFKQYMVSHERASRIEVASVLKSNKEEESANRNIFQKLAGMGKT